MATAWTRDDALRPYISDIDVQQYGKVLVGLQDSYDKNVSALTALDLQLKDIAEKQLIRPQDREYFYGRMKERKAALEKNMGNFAHDNELQYGMKTLMDAVDDDVITGIQNSQVKANILKEYEEAKKSKNPDKANITNLEHSLQDVSKWETSNTPIGERFRGNRNYTPYTDIMKEVNTYLANLEPGSFAVNEGNGIQIRNTKGEYLQPARVKEIVDLVKSSNANVAKQIEINGWATYRGIDDTSFLNFSKDVLAKKAARYEEEAKSEEAALQGLKDGGDAARYESALRSHQYNKSRSKYLSDILNGDEKNPGLLNAKQLDEQSRRRLESLFAEEDIKSAAAGTFAYTKIKSSDIEVNPITKFQTENEWKLREFEQKEKQYQLDLVKEFTKNNPGATAEQMKAAGISESVINQVFAPNTTQTVEAEIKKTGSYDESVKAISEQKEAIYSEVGELASKLAILRGDDKKLAQESKEKWINKWYDQQVADPDSKYKNVPTSEGGTKGTNLDAYRSALQESLKNNPNMTKDEADVIEQMIEKINDLDRYKSLEGKIRNNTMGFIETNGRYDANRFSKLPSKYGKSNDNILIDKLTGREVSKATAIQLSRFPDGVDPKRFTKYTNDFNQTMYKDALTNENVNAIEAKKRTIAEESKNNTGSNENIQKLAEEAGVILFASEGNPYKITDYNAIANALKFVDDKELEGYGITDAKGVKEAIDKAITTKDFKDFPITSLTIKADGTPVLIKKGGDEVILKGFSDNSQIGLMVNKFKEQQFVQKDRARRSAALIADARKGVYVIPRSINGKNATVNIQADNSKMWGEITFDGQKYMIEDENGRKLFYPLQDKVYNNVQVYSKINEYIDETIRKITKLEEAKNAARK